MLHPYRIMVVDHPNDAEFKIIKNRKSKIEDSRFFDGLIP